MASPAKKTESLASIAKVTYEQISPEQATQYVANGYTRSVLYSHIISRHARTMLRGFWRNFHWDPIVFNSDGEILNGAYRLHALIMAKMTLPFLIVRCKTDQRRMLEVGDTGVRRSPRDLLKAMLPKDIRIHSYAPGTLKTMLYGHLPSHYGPLGPCEPDQFVRHYETYQGQVNWAIDNVRAGQRGLGLLPVKGAVARAASHIDQGQLQQAITILQRADDSKAHHGALLNLRALLTDPEELAQVTRQDIYGYTINAIDRWYSQSSNDDLVVAPISTFPLSEDDEIPEDIDALQR